MSAQPELRFLRRKIEGGCMATRVYWGDSYLGLIQFDPRLDAYRFQHSPRSPIRFSITPDPKLRIVVGAVRLAFSIIARAGNSPRVLLSLLNSRNA